MKQKVYFLGWYLPSFVGGAEKSILEELKEYQKKKHDVYAVTFDEKYPRGDYEIEGIKGFNFSLNWNATTLSPFITLLLNYSFFKKSLGKFDFNPTDLILTQGLIAPFIAQYCMNQNLTYQYYLRDERNLNVFHNYRRGYTWLLKAIKDTLDTPFRWHYISQNTQALKHAKVIVSNSQFIAKLLKEKYSIYSAIKLPQINFENLKSFESSPEKQSFITFMGGENPMKGHDVVLKIAQKMPNEHFLILGPYEQEIQKANITFCPQYKEIVKVFEKTKLLIVPSRVNEAYGRVVIEASFCGIPVITSSKGGLVESNPIKEHIVENVDDIEAWVHTCCKAITS